MSGAFLNSYRGYRATPLLWMDFESSGLLTPMHCKATGRQFGITDSGDPGAMILTSTEKKWGTSALDGNNQTSGSGSYKCVSLTNHLDWDLLSNNNDFCAGIWVNMHHWSTSTKNIWTLGTELGDSNTFIYLGVRQSSSNAVFTFSAPQGTTILVSITQTVPLPSGWFFVAVARRNGTLGMSINGAATASTIGGGIGLAAPQACGFGICNGTLQDNGTGQLGGIVDHFHVYREQIYDVFNGFSVPTSAPVL